MNRKMACRTPVFAAVALLLLTAGGMGEANEIFDVQHVTGQWVRPGEFDWFDVFDSNGALRLPSFIQPGLRDAVFIEDRISRGILTDLSALVPGASSADLPVYNAPVPPPHDLGNAYLIARVEDIDLQLDLLIERSSGDEDASSFVEIELNRDIVALSAGRRFATIGAPSGNPVGPELRWPFRGERRDGDLLLRVDLQGRNVTAIRLERWSEIDGIVGFHVVETGDNLAGQSCFGVASIYTICGGALVPDERGRTYIANGDSEQPYTPDSFVKVDFNLGSMVALEPDFTTATIRTPRDIAFGSFRAFGHFAQPQDDRPSTVD